MKALEIAEKMFARGYLMGKADTLVELGEISGELTEAQARKKYGTPFVDAITYGGFKPCRLGKGTNKVVKYYSVTDWIRYKTTRQVKAFIEN